MSALLAEDTEMLASIIAIAAELQGTKIDPFTGEEPGKIFHEYPGVVINERSTLYAASDTTALFLLAIHKYEELTGDRSYRDTYRSAIEVAAAYIHSHIKDDGLFWEDPKAWNSDHGALKVTYWKDSEILDREGGVPAYPAVFTLAHIQNLAGMRAAYALTGNTGLLRTIDAMKQGIHVLYDPAVGQMMIAKDQAGPLFAVSDDFLHGLYYLEPGDLSEQELTSIDTTAAILTTLYGFRTNSPDKCDLNSRYHSCSLWPFEQGFIYQGCKKFGLTDLAAVAQGVVGLLDTYHEYYLLDNEGKIVQKSGNPEQLWTWAVARFFAREHERGSHLSFDKSVIRNSFAQFVQEKQSSIHNLSEFIKGVQGVPSASLIAIGGTNTSSIVLRHGVSSAQVIQKTPNLSSQLDLVDLVLRTCAPDVDTMLVSFAFPLQPVTTNAGCDGILLSGGKQHNLNDLVGMQVGATLAEALYKRTGKVYMVQVLNDQLVALAWLRAQSIKDGIVGVAGTGFNLSYLQNGIPYVLEPKHLSITDPLTGALHSAEYYVGGAYLPHYISSLDSRYHIESMQEVLESLDRTDDQGVVVRKALGFSARLLASYIDVLSDRVGVSEIWMEGSVFWNTPGYIDLVQESLVKQVQFKKLPTQIEMLKSITAL